jgi:hypothetical protein
MLFLVRVVFQYETAQQPQPGYIAFSNLNEYSILLNSFFLRKEAGNVQDETIGNLYSSSNVH